MFGASDPPDLLPSPSRDEDPGESLELDNQPSVGAADLRIVSVEAIDLICVGDEVVLDVGRRCVRRCRARPCGVQAYPLPRERPVIPPPIVVTSSSLLQ